MEITKKQVILKYIYKVLFTLFIGSILITFVIFTRDFTNVTDQQTKYKILADAFTIPGVILTLITPLVWLVDEGTLSGVSYSLKKFFAHLIPFAGFKDETYAEYCAKRKKHTGYSYFLVSGLIYLTVGIVFTILYF